MVGLDRLVSGMLVLGIVSEIAAQNTLFWGMDAPLAETCCFLGSSTKSLRKRRSTRLAKRRREQAAGCGDVNEIVQHTPVSPSQQDRCTMKPAFLAISTKLVESHSLRRVNAVRPVWCLVRGECCCHGQTRASLDQFVEVTTNSIFCTTILLAWP